MLGNNRDSVEFLCLPCFCSFLGTIPMLSLGHQVVLEETALFSYGKTKERIQKLLCQTISYRDSDPLHPRLPVTTHSHLCPLSTRVCHRFHVSSLDPLFSLSLCYIALALSLGRKPALSIVQLPCLYWDFSKSACARVPW